MNAAPRTIVSLIRMRTLATTPGNLAPDLIIHVDAAMSDGSTAVLFSTRLDMPAIDESDLIGLTAQQAYEVAAERGIAL